MNSFKTSLLPFIFAAFFLAGCSKDKPKIEPEEEVEVIPPYSEPPQKATKDITAVHALPYFRNLLSGTTTYTSGLHIEDWLSRPFSVPSYGRMLPGNTLLQMIAVGGGMTAGAQNGGLYRQGQLGAYPNLVARQLGMTDFSTPAFGKNEANGTGYFLLTNHGIPSPSFDKVTNNLTTIIPEADGYPPVFGNFEGKAHNFSAPWLSGDYLGNASWAPWMIGRVESGVNASWAPPLPYLWRFTPRSEYANSGLIKYIKNTQTYNFFLLEYASETFFSVLRFKDRRSFDYLDFVGDIVSKVPTGRILIRLLAEGGKKGVIFTMPQFEDLGFASWELSIIDDIELINYRNGVNISNKEVRKWAIEYDMALVDLEMIYKSVHLGEYKLENGLPVDGSIRGNFFSSDGMYPTTLGQVIIANEVLKAINQTYQAKAPLIDITTYAKQIGMDLKVGQ